VEAPCAAEENRPLIAQQFEPAAGRNRWTFDQTRPILLAALAESHRTRRLFGSLVRRIAALPMLAG
jgi:hypothetical protein